jgi:hypothetical protein
MQALSEHQSKEWAFVVLSPPLNYFKVARDSNAFSWIKNMESRRDFYVVPSYVEYEDLLALCQGGYILTSGGAGSLTGPLVHGIPLTVFYDGTGNDKVHNWEVVKSLDVGVSFGDSSKVCRGIAFTKELEELGTTRILVNTLMEALAPERHSAMLERARNLCKRIWAAGTKKGLAHDLAHYPTKIMRLLLSPGKTTAEDKKKTAGGDKDILQKQKKKLTTVLKKSRPAAVYTPKTKKSKSTLEQETPTTSPVTNAKAKTKAIAKAKTKAKPKASQKKKNKRPTPKIPKIKNQSCQKLSAPPKHRVVPPFCATNCIGKIKQGLNGNAYISKLVKRKKDGAEYGSWCKVRKD